MKEPQATRIIQRAADQHPLIFGLLKMLPRPESDWGRADRIKWLVAAAAIFDLIYGDSGAIEIIKKDQ